MLSAAPRGRLVVPGSAVVAGRAYTVSGTGPPDWALTRSSPSGRATVAGSIYSSHGLARHLTR